LCHYQVQFLLIVQQQHVQNLVYQQNHIIIIVLQISVRRLTKKNYSFVKWFTFLDKSFNEDDEYVEEEELNSELEDSDLEINLKNKQQKFNPNIIRNKIIKIFKRKPNQSTNTPNRNTNQIPTNPTNLSHQHPTFIMDRQSDIEEDPPSDLSDSTIPVDQWSIESVPKPGFIPFEHLQTLKFVS